MINVLIADDHPIVRQGLKQALSDTEDIKVTDEAGDGAEVMLKLRKNIFDVVLLDIAMPSRGGIDVLKQMKSSKIEVPVLVLSIYPEEQYAVRALRAGASGYLTKNCETETLIKAIKKVASGGKYISETLAEKLAYEIGLDYEKPVHTALSDREFYVFSMIALGKTVSEIAGEMALSVKTISTYRARILKKMNMKNNADITRYALKNNLVD
jgi:DNA-binding NarL/FixJ family response regulator